MRSAQTPLAFVLNLRGKFHGCAPGQQHTLRRRARQLGSLGMPALLERLWRRHRREGWAHCRRQGRHRPSREPGPPGSQRQVRLGGQQQRSPGHPSDDPPGQGRRAGEGQLGRSHGVLHGKVQAGLGPGPRKPGLLQLRSTHARRVLHPGQAVARRAAVVQHRRQHPLVHGDVCHGPDVQLRRRWARCVVRRCGPGRLAVPVRTQRRRGTDRAVGAHVVREGAQWRAHHRRRPAQEPHGAPGCRPASANQDRHERGADERPHPPAHSQRQRRPAFRRGAHGRLRQPQGGGGRVSAREGGGHLRHPAGATGDGGRVDRCLQTHGLHRAARLLPIRRGNGGIVAGQYSPSAHGRDRQAWAQVRC